MLRAVVLAGCCFVFVPNLGLAQVSIRSQVPEGKTLITESSVSVVQKLTIAGQETNTTSDTQIVTRAESGKRDADGKLRVKESVESLKITIGGTAGDYSFDSKQLDQSGTSALEILRDIHKAMARRTVVKVYNRENRVEKVEAEDLIGGLPIEVQQLVRDQLDPEYQKKAANQELDQYPKDPVKPGDQWKHTTDMSFGAGQRMMLQSEYTYDGPVQVDGRMLHKITAKAVDVDFFLENSPLPLTLKESKLKVAESQDTLWFDPAINLIVKVESKTRITGDLTFSVNDMDLPSMLDLTITSTSRTRH